MEQKLINAIELAVSGFLAEGGTMQQVSEVLQHKIDTLEDEEEEDVA